MPSDLFNDGRVVAFVEHCKQEHNARHDDPCATCDRLWSRIDFGWKRQPERRARKKAVA